MCRAAARSVAVATGGSGTRGVMEARTARRVIKEVRCSKTGIVGQVSEVVVKATGGCILVREGKVEFYSRGWGPLGCTSVS